MSDLLNSASLVMIPSGYKEDILYSEIPTDGSGDMAFTRASNGTRINSAGLVEVCPWNLLSDSENFSSWSLEGGTLTSGQTDPNGGSTAYKYVQVPGGGLYSGGIVTADVKFAQVWIKSVSGGAITVNISDGAAFFGTFNVTGTWQLFTAPYTANSRNGIYLYAISNASGIYVWHPQLNIGSTAKPYFPTTDRLNVPRLTYQNGGGGCPSLLLEKQSTNNFSYSEQFDNATWSRLNSSVTANSTTSPDGTTNADKIVEDTANSGHTIYQYYSSTTGTVYTFSVFAKASERTKLWMDFFGGGSVGVFDLSNGTVITTSGAGITAKIENFGNGWYRCSISQVAAGTDLYPNFGPTINNTTSPTYQGNGTSGIFVYGAQLEASSYPTSYIVSTSSSATRVADVMTVNLPNTNMTFTAYLECEEAPIGTAAGDWFSIYSNVSVLGRAYGYANTFGFADAYNLGVASGTKMVWKQESGSTGKLFKGGALVGTSTTGTYTDPFNRFRIDGAYLDKPVKIKEFVFFDNALTDAECIQLTA